MFNVAFCDCMIEFQNLYRQLWAHPSPINHPSIRCSMPTVTSESCWPQDRTLATHKNYSFAISRQFSAATSAQIVRHAFWFTAFGKMIRPTLKSKLQRNCWDITISTSSSSTGQKVHEQSITLQLLVVYLQLVRSPLHIWISWTKIHCWTLAVWLWLDSVLVPTLPERLARILVVDEWKTLLVSTQLVSNWFSFVATVKITEPLC